MVNLFVYDEFANMLTNEHMNTNGRANACICSIYQSPCFSYEQCHISTFSTATREHAGLVIAAMSAGNIDSAAARCSTLAASTTAVEPGSPASLDGRSSLVGGPTGPLDAVMDADNNAQRPQQLALGGRLEEDAEKRLDRRIGQMCRLLWDKVIKLDEDFAEVRQVANAADKAAGSAADAAAKTIKRYEAEDFARRTSIDDVVKAQGEFEKEF